MWALGQPWGTLRTDLSLANGGCVSYCSRLPGRGSHTQPGRSTVPREETAPLLLDYHLTCCRSMKTSPTGGDSPAAILVQDLRAWAKYQPFSFTGRHPANLESGITCGERAGQGNVVGDCWPLPSTPLAPNPERSPHRPSGNIPGITRTGLSPGTLQRGGEDGPACAALCTGSHHSRAGGTLSSSERPAAWRVQGPTERAATHSSCTGCAREGKASCSATSPPARLCKAGARLTTGEG